MILENLIPASYAQGFASTTKQTATVGKDVAVEKGEAGIQGLVKFIAVNIDNWIAGIVIVIISWIIAKMVAGAIKREIIKKKGEDVQESVLVLVERITTIVILTVGITIAAAINGLNFTAVIGALSLGIGFALKDIIGNFISGIIMLSQDRIKIGDFIKVGDILGTIVSIDTRATILQAVDGTEVVIPNQSMLNEKLISYTTNPFRRIELIVGVDYSTDLPMVTSLVKGLMDKDSHIVPKPESVVLVDEFGDSSINLKIRFWIESSTDWLSIRSNLANRIKKAFDDLGISIPFPIHTLKLDEDDRSFLKTMDSMKKGVVPEPAAVPNKDQIRNVAEKTSKEGRIPYDVFEKPKPAAPPAPVAAKPAETLTTPTPKPEPTPAAAPTTSPPLPTAEVKKEPVGAAVSAAAPVPEKPKEEPIIPPPTHL